MEAANKSVEIEFETVFKDQSPEAAPTRDASPCILGESEIVSPVPRSLQDTTSSEKAGFSLRTKRIGRVGIFFVVVGVLIIGRFSVPDNAVPCVEDKALTALKFANDFINKPGNEVLRSAFQAVCSFFVDAVFFITFGYWIMRGGSRLPLTLAIFYVTRALVQKVWFSPYPEGFYWDDPGVPSLVVPYGRGSDFFFSGHSGFLIICAREMHKIGNRKLRNLSLVVAVYTILILLTYRIHYSIDVFAGVFFADWTYLRVDMFHEKVDALWLRITMRIKTLLTRKAKPQRSEKVLVYEENPVRVEVQP